MQQRKSGRISSKSAYWVYIFLPAIILFPLAKKWKKLKSWCRHKIRPRSGDLIEVRKILSEKRVDKAKFFKPAVDNHGLRGHTQSQKLFKLRCKTTVRIR